MVSLKKSSVAIITLVVSVAIFVIALVANFLKPNSTAPKASGDSMVLEVSDNSIVSKKSDDSIVSKASDNSIVSKASDNSIVSKASGGSTVLEVSDNSTAPKASGDSMVLEVSDNSIVSKISDDSIVSKASDNSIVSKASGDKTPPTSPSHSNTSLRRGHSQIINNGNDIIIDAGEVSFICSANDDGKLSIKKYMSARRRAIAGDDESDDENRSMSSVVSRSNSKIINYGTEAIIFTQFKERFVITVNDLKQVTLKQVDGDQCNQQGGKNMNSTNSLQQAWWDRVKQASSSTTGENDSTASAWDENECNELKDVKMGKFTNVTFENNKSINSSGGLTNKKDQDGSDAKKVDLAQTNDKLETENDEVLADNNDDLNNEKE